MAILLLNARLSNRKNIGNLKTCNIYDIHTTAKMYKIFKIRFTLFNNTLGKPKPKKKKRKKDHPG